MTVTASPLREDAVMGPNQQPEWTARRRFSETRVYVLPPWELAVDLNWEALKPRGGDAEGGDAEEGGTDLQHTLTQEIELGLPYRFQIDTELSGGTDPGRDNEWRFLSGSLELRWALASWDVIPLNPTLFGEWKFRNAEADSYELRLLLGDELAPLWHYGIDFFYEHQVGDDFEQEFAVSGALSYSVIDDVAGIGVEMKFNAERVPLGNEDTGDYEYRFEIGPSFQWRPWERFHIDFVPLFGATDKSPTIDSFVIVGFDLGSGGERDQVSEPASLRNK